MPSLQAGERRSAMNWKQIVDAACELIWTVESVVMIYWWYTERKKKP
jgi:hypothetical protein